MGSLACVIFLLFAVSVAVSLFAYTFFWFENSASFRSGKRSFIELLGGFFSGIFSLPMVIVCFPFGWTGKLQRPKSVSSSEPVIILTHGLYHNASGWALFKRRLHKAGFNNIFLMNYGSFFTSFENVLEKFEGFVSEVRQSTPGQPLILIGHSLGGLVSRVYAEKANEQEAPLAVITLGAPHQGSRMTAFGPGQLASSLVYRGPLYEELERMGREIPCPAIAFYSPADALVLPEEGLKAPYGGWIHCETAPVSHVSMLFSASVSRQVIDQVNCILNR
ncbi:MAG: alpha/beta fold hydrolase [Desulfobacteraceae bacterium]|nr:alpha/beta fold hydrolase [Desulfobacteraceae bacterium]